MNIPLSAAAADDPPHRRQQRGVRAHLKEYGHSGRCLGDGERFASARVRDVSVSAWPEPGARRPGAPRSTLTVALMILLATCLHARGIRRTGLSQDAAKEKEEKAIPVSCGWSSLPPRRRSQWPCGSWRTVSRWCSPPGMVARPGACRPARLRLRAGPRWWRRATRAVSCSSEPAPRGGRACPPPCSTRSSADDPNLVAVYLAEGMTEGAATSPPGSSLVKVNASSSSPRCTTAPSCPRVRGPRSVVSTGPRAVHPSLSRKGACLTNDGRTFLPFRDGSFVYGAPCCYPPPPPKG